MIYDVIVIGSGISGMFASAILSKHGKKVALVEKHTETSPLLRRYTREGAYCDSGFHYSSGLGDGGQFRTFLKYLGVADQMEVAHMDQECFDIIHLNGREYRFPYGHDRVQDFLIASFPASRNAIRKLFAKMQSIIKRTACLNFELAFGEFPEEITENQSLGEYMRQEGAEKELIALLGRHSEILCGSPCEEIPLFVYTCLMGLFYERSSTIVGGGDTLANLLLAKIKEYGVDVFLSSGAKTLKVNASKEIEGVLLDNGTFLSCRQCISTIHPQLLVDMIPEKTVRPAYISRITGYENTMGPHALFIDLNDIPDKIARTNYYYFNDNGPIVSHIDFLAFMAVNVYTETGKKRSLTVLSYREDQPFIKYMNQADSKAKSEYRQLKSEMKEEQIESVYRVFPELRGKAKVIDFATPCTYKSFTGTVNGSTYGLKQTVKAIPLNQKTPIAGFFLAGQSLMPGVLGSMISSILAVSKIVDIKNFWKEVQKCL
jgi:all-trans-retinol 13,14-reductase